LSGESPRISLERIAVREFRLLERVDLELGPRLTVIAGDNGQGKTALLEAIYFAATSRSFRTVRPAELVRHGAPVATVRARFVERGGLLPELAREQTGAIEGKRVTVRTDGNKPSSLSEFATRSPVVVFHAGELALSSGPAGARRLLLDRLALYQDPASAGHRARYALALKSRQKLLKRSPDEPPPEARVFEELCAHHGAALTKARRAAADALEGELVRAFAEIAAPGLTLSVHYRPGGGGDEAEALASLERDRARDGYRASAGFGPHRDELELELDGHPARVVASQGQHRALTLALKAAEMAAIARARGLVPLLLLDDVSSELDRHRTEALFAFLGIGHGQIVLTTTRPELIEAPRMGSAVWRVVLLERGAIAGSPPAQKA
jgi:DNA replication and repair protein RecF